MLKLVEGREWELLSLVRSVRPEELYEVTPEVEQLLAQYEPEEIARLEAAWLRVIKDWLPKTEKRDPAAVMEALSTLKPEMRLSGLKPEERLSGLKPEERKALLKLLSEQEKDEQA